MSRTLLKYGVLTYTQIFPYNAQVTRIKSSLRKIRVFLFLSPGRESSILDKPQSDTKTNLKIKLIGMSRAIGLIHCVVWLYSRASQNLPSRFQDMFFKGCCNYTKANTHTDHQGLKDFCTKVGVTIYAMVSNAHQHTRTHLKIEDVYKIKVNN
eukprot:6485151-Amphidinium_carterae.1